MKDQKINRIYILGTIGAGKSTLAKKLSKELGIKHYDMDDLYWTKKFTKKRDKKILLKRVKSITKRKKWIIEGVFLSGTEEAFKKADLLIWLDLEPKFLRNNILKRYFIDKLKRRGKARGNLKDIIRQIKHTKKYRTGDHKNSYKNHKKRIDKHKTPFISIKTKKQLKQFLKDLK
jgi:adenylate kinase family enzyme